MEITREDEARRLCQKPSHRGQDWRNDAGILICGVCHPPADPRRVTAVVTKHGETPILRASQIAPPTLTLIDGLGSETPGLGSETADLVSDEPVTLL